MIFPRIEGVKMLSVRRMYRTREIARTVEKKAVAAKTNWPVRVQAETKDGTLDIEGYRPS